MTLIVGIEHEGGVTMAADAGVWDDFAHCLAGPKILRRREMLFGVAGNLRTRNIFEHMVDPPPPGDDQPERYLVRQLGPAILEAFREAGCWHKPGDDGTEQAESFVMLVGIQGELWEVGSDLSVSRVRRAFTAIGQSAGIGVALGHLTATASTALPPDHRCTEALAAAAELTDRVRAPWQVEHLPR